MRHGTGETHGKLSHGGCRNRASVIQSDEKRRDYHKRKRNVGFDVERKAYDMWGVNVFEIPGISHLTALGLMSELGHDFTRKFPSSKQFCCWCNIAPNTKISGGKRISSHVPHRRNNVGLILEVSLLRSPMRRTSWETSTAGYVHGPEVKPQSLPPPTRSLRYSLPWLQTRQLIIRKSRYRRESITRKTDCEIQA